MLDGEKGKFVLFSGLAVGVWIIVAAVNQYRVDAGRQAEARVIADEWERTKGQQAAQARADQERLAAQGAAAQAALAARQKDEADANAKAFAALQDASVGARVAALRKACQSGCDDAEVERVEKAAHSDAERKTLQDLADHFEVERIQAAEKQRQSAAQVARQRFADSYDEALLNRHMNPDGVRAVGTTLHVEGWFCSRQFMFDFQHTMANEAHAVGFTRVSCESGLETWSAQL